MSERSDHFLHTLTDDDWQIIITALHKLGSLRSKQLSVDCLAWRTEVADSRLKFLRHLRVFLS